MQCNITVRCIALLQKQLYIKLIFLACKGALHLEGSQDITQEPHATGNVSARGGERKKSFDLLQIFISTQD